MSKITKILKAQDGHGVTIWFHRDNPLEFHSQTNSVKDEKGDITPLPEGVMFIDGTLEVFGNNKEQVAKVLGMFLDSSFTGTLSNF